MHAIGSSYRCLARPPRGPLACVTGLMLALAQAGDASAQAAKQAKEVPQIGASGLKVPRYVSLKADRVQLRAGPGTDHPASWVFQRTGLPVEVIQEVEVWHQVRDAGGTVGWVHGSLLSGRRTALILPWEVKDGQAKASAMLRDDDSQNAQPLAQVEAGTLASIIACDNGWCRVSIQGYRGYIEQAKLWGTYPDERIK